MGDNLIVTIIGRDVDGAVVCELVYLGPNLHTAKTHYEHWQKAREGWVANITTIRGPETYPCMGSMALGVLNVLPENTGK